MDKRYNYYVRPYLEESMLEKIKRITLNIIKSVVKFVTDIWSKIIKKINELKERFKNNPQIQSLLSKINNSKIMQTINIAKRNKSRVERSNSIDEINKCKQEVEDAKNIQQQEVENAKNIFSKIKENVSNNNNQTMSKEDLKRIENAKKQMSNRVMNYIKTGDKLGVRLTLGDRLMSDRENNFKAADDLLAECKKNGLDPFENKEYDLETDKNKWNRDYMNIMMIQFKSGGDYKLYNHLKNVINYVYSN